jgi:hypothetical protein
MTPFALDNPDYHLLLPVLLFCAVGYFAFP